MVTENNSQINSFTGGMDSDTSYQMLGSNKYVYAENLRITSVNTTNNGNTENAQGEIRPILGVTKCELNGDSEKIDRILACGSIRNYGIIIYTSSDKNPNGTSTWRVGRFINRKPEDLESNTDEYKKINEVYKDDEFHNLTFTKIFDSRHSTDVKKFSIEFRYEDEDVIKLYIADSQNPIITLNIAESNDNAYKNSLDYDNMPDYNPIEDVIAYPKITFTPFEFDAIIAGNLKPALVQYSYSLYTKNGIFTDISPTTKLIPIIDNKGGKNTNGFAKEVEHSTMGIQLSLNLDEKYIKTFNKIKVYRITYVENGQTPVVEIIIDEKISSLRSGSKYIVRDSGIKALDTITLEEYNNKSGVHIIPKIIESHQDYLFAANVKTNKSFLTDEELDKIKITPYFVKIRLIGDGQYNKDHFTKELTDPFDGKKYTPYTLPANVCTNTTIEKLGVIKLAQKPTSDFTTDFFDIKVYDQFGKYIDRTDVSNKLYEKAEEYLSKISEKIKYLDYSDPFVTYYLKSLRRDETYRYGIIFYNKYGEASKVRYISDINVPNMNQFGFETFAYQGSVQNSTLPVEDANLYVFPIGMIFDIQYPNEKYIDNIVSYEILRCNRGFDDTKNIYQGVISRPCQKQKYNVSVDQRLLDDISGNREENAYQYNPTGFISDKEYHISNIHGDKENGFFKPYTDEGTIYQEIYYGTNKYNLNFLQFICPEVCYEKETVLSSLKYNNFQLQLNSFVSPLIQEIVPALVDPNSQENYYGYIPPIANIRDHSSLGLYSNNKAASIIRMRFNDVFVGNNLQMRMDSGVGSPENENDKPIGKFYRYTATGLIENQIIQNWSYYTTSWTTNKLKLAENKYLYNSDWLSGEYDFTTNLYPDESAYQTTYDSTGTGTGSFINRQIGIKPNQYSTIKLYTFEHIGQFGLPPSCNIKDIGVSNDLNWDEVLNYKKDNPSQTDPIWQNHISVVGNYEFLNCTLGAKSDKMFTDIDQSVSSNLYVWQCYASNGGPCILMNVDLSDFENSSEIFNTQTLYNPNFVPNTNLMKNVAQRLLGTHICNIQHIVIPYGGDSETAKYTSNYYSYGDFYDKKECAPVIFDGDTFIQPFEYIATHKTYTAAFEDTGMSRCNVYYIPLETSINLAYTYGQEISKNSNTRGITNVQLKPSDVYNTFVQDEPLYLYNSAYSSNSVSRIYAGSPKEEDANELNNTDYRVYHSELKANKEQEESWVKFQSANYIDLETKEGQITELKSFNDDLMFWQQRAFGKLGVNDRSIITDDSNLPTILGTGGVLDRYYYIDRTSGMAEEEYCDTTSASTLYWFDDYNQELKAYRGGQSTINMSKQGNVQNIMQQFAYPDTYASVTYDPQYNEVIFNVLKDKQIVYNEKLNEFISIYTLDYDDSIVFPNKIYLINNKGIAQWNYTNTNTPKDLSGNILSTKLIYSVNKNTSFTKVFDNQEIITANKLDVLGGIDGTINDEWKIDDTYFQNHHSYKWITDLNSSETSNLNITNREGNYRFAIPRKNNSEYGDRIRGKYMVSTIEDSMPDCNTSISYIITKFRTSWI